MIDSTVPVGMVVAFAGQIYPDSAEINTDSAPTCVIEQMGWMACDGRSLLVAQYPELFAVLGYLYGKGDEGNKFQIPDYRGYFLRCVDAGADNDPDKKSRTAPDGGTITGVGSIQDDALHNHEHPYQSVTTPVTPSEEGPAIGAPTTKLENTQKITKEIWVSENETRPKNVYVNYIIKYASR